MSEMQMPSSSYNVQLQHSAKPTMSAFVESNSNKATKLVLRQLSNYWDDFDKDIIAAVVPKALEEIELSFRVLPNKRFFDGEKVIFLPHMSIHWMIFLYRLSHVLYKNGGGGSKRSGLLLLFE